MTNAQHRIKALTELAGEYYQLADSVLIEKPHELLRVTHIIDSKHEKHPHENHKVYISRKAIKHFVEERRGELSKNHSSVAVLQRIIFAMEQIVEIILNFDKYEYEVDPEKHFYIKHYSGNPSIRVLCERKNDTLEICSIHFTKQRKDK